MEFLSAATTSGDYVTEAAFEGKPMNGPEDLQPLLENASTKLWPVYRLRAVVRILETVDNALEKVVGAEMHYSQNPIEGERQELAHRLRMLEGAFLANMTEALTAEVG